MVVKIVALAIHGFYFYFLKVKFKTLFQFITKLWGEIVGERKKNNKIILQNLLLCYYNSNIKDNNSATQKRVTEKKHNKTKTSY